MAVLAEITVATADLEAIVPDIQEYLFDGQADFADEILAAKVEVFGQIKEDYESKNPGYDEAQIIADLALVKDYPDELCIKDRIAKTTIAIILRQNKRYDEMAIYQNEAEKVPFHYHVDIDDDDVIDSGEEFVGQQFPTLGR